ncbi:MAG TPA: hypothetical protein VFA68_21240 [Terriglobales bacterium]|nr:hypothetical protein [Terriglobales bacterium]
MRHGEIPCHAGLLRVKKEHISVLAQIAVLATPAAMVLHQGDAAIDPDVGWHLQTANWILQHHALPHSDPFSYTRAGAPWAAYSWLFELLLGGFYRILGLRGIVLYTALMALVISWALLRLLSRYVEPIPAAALTAVGLYLTYPLLWPRPGLFTVLFFILQLDYLLRARIEHNARYGWWIPLLYLLWANLHIQFVYGLFTLAVAAAEPWIRKLLRQPVSPEEWAVSQVLWKLLAASFAATLLNPYFVGIYTVVWQYATQTKAFDIIIELQALDFRRIKDYVELMLALVVALSLGYRRQFRPLFVILFVAFTMAAFRAERDSWFLVTVGLAILAVVSDRRPGARTPEWHKPIVLVITCFVIAVAASLSPNFDENALKTQVDSIYPSQACHFLESAHYSGPLFSLLDWGGYLIWKLPEMQVAIDGRTNLYGDEFLTLVEDSWDGKPAWLTNPQLDQAKVILAPKGVALTFILANLDKYEIIYEDGQCIILVRK